MVIQYLLPTHIESIVESYSKIRGRKGIQKFRIPTRGAESLTQLPEDNYVC